MNGIVIDTPLRYGLVSRVLHWLVAVMLGWQFLREACWVLLGNGAVLDTFSRFGPSHKTTGAMVFLLIIPRIVWATINRRRRPPADNGIIGKVAIAVHWTMYLLLLVVPGLALLRVYGEGKGFEFFGISLIAATGVKNTRFTDSADLLHAPLAWLLAVLMAGHVAMAVVHAMIYRDGKMARMVGSIQCNKCSLGKA